MKYFTPDAYGLSMLGASPLNATPAVGAKESRQTATVTGEGGADIGFGDFASASILAFATCRSCPKPDATASDACESFS